MYYCDAIHLCCCSYSLIITDRFAIKILNIQLFLCLVPLHLESKVALYNIVVWLFHYHKRFSMSSGVLFLQLSYWMSSVANNAVLNSDPDQSIRSSTFELEPVDADVGVEINQLTKVRLNSS